MGNFIRSFSALGRKQKIALQLLVDAGLMIICFLLAMTIRLESVTFLSREGVWLPVAIALLVALATFWLAGLYRSLMRFVSGKILSSIAQGTSAFSLILLLSSGLLDAGIPRSVPLIAGVILFLAIGGLRFFVRHIFRSPRQVAKKAVVIYGAGEAGVELFNSIYHGRDYAPVAFVDDNKQLHGLTISGVRVHPPEAISRLAIEKSVEVILMAMPKSTHARRRKVFASLEALNLEVKTIPAMSDMISGKAKISELRNVGAEDLLGRDPVAPDNGLLKQNIAGKVVMVTGAGGSIGSELCRQILSQHPQKLVLFEVSEFALYSIEVELSEAAKRLGLLVEICPVLGSVQDSKRLEAVIKSFHVNTIYHAAAYKHVPLVEDNVVEGIRNNAFGTFLLAKLAHENAVESFILISTDKAVRPTNVMGATKRIAELICQSFAQSDTKTTYSMVRFGNVLGSSGSVIPRFRSQIASGGPVTVTHREINRYFMTIPEASQLVIQAGAMAQGGDVFVLDMGDPVKIADLAVTMVKLHGLTPYFVDDPEDVFPDQGDIPICFTGLRKGEKLYEELLVGNNPQATEHPRVMTAKEVALTSDELLPVLDQLFAACADFDLPTIQTILLDLPLEYKPLDTEFSDQVWSAARERVQREELEAPLPVNH